MIDRERAQAVLTSIAISLDDDPSRCVADTEVKNLALGDQDVERVHQFGDAGSKVPGLNVVLFWINLMH